MSYKIQDIHYENGISKQFIVGKPMKNILKHIRVFQIMQKTPCVLIVERDHYMYLEQLLVTTQTNNVKLSITTNVPFLDFMTLRYSE